MQPSHRTTDLPEAQRAWGAERMRGAYAFAALHDDGAPLCFGSDAPIEDLAPLAGVRSAVEGGLPVVGGARRILVGRRTRPPR